jgi:hypothetical protein
MLLVTRTKFPAVSKNVRDAKKCVGVTLTSLWNLELMFGNTTTRIGSHPKHMFHLGCSSIATTNQPLELCVRYFVLK